MTIPPKVQRVFGQDIEKYIPALAALRIEVFREYPYLYDGSLDYEKRYLASYATAPDAVLVLATLGEPVIGLATGMPLSAQPQEIQAPFAARGADLGSIYYFAESVLQSDHRGRGIGSRFFDEREAHVTERPKYTSVCFCAVDRGDDHPARPPGHQPLDGFWQNRGYKRDASLVAQLSWRDLGETTETEKPMVFWTKSIATGGTP